MLFFLFSLITAISQRLCVCQPDRPGEVCSLSEKCNNFNNLNQIILIERKPTKSSRSEVNVFKILRTAKKSNENQINLDFEVYGSLPSNPILFNFSRIESIFDGEQNLKATIKIRGGEWKQTINISGLSDLSSKTESNLSLSISDVTVYFDTNRKEASSAYLDTLKISKSKLIVSPEKSFVFKSRGLFTDTISSYADFHGKIVAKELKYIGNPKPESIRDLNLPIELTNGSQISREIKIEEDPESQSEYSNFVYSFCLSNRNDADRNFEDLACDMHGVPKDRNHYISIEDTDVINIISKAPSMTNIRFYLTASSLANPCSINIQRFENDNLTILFQVADPDFSATLALKTTALFNATRDQFNINVTFNSISSVNIDPKLLATFYNVTFRSSPVVFDSDNQNGTIRNLVTDALSISEFSKNLTILESIEIKKTAPRKLKGKIYLSENTQMYVPQVSYFPVILYNFNENENWISFCDEFEYIKMPFYFYNVTINATLSDDMPSVTDIINITFRNDAGRERPEMDNSSLIYINTVIPEQGINITFGSEENKNKNNDKLQWPPNSVFAFYSFAESVSQNPNAYITINDGFYINDTNVNQSIFMLFNKCNITLLTPESFTPFLSGVNLKHDECPIKGPYFMKSTCWHTTAYKIDNIHLDIQKNLQKVFFEGDTTYLKGSGTDEIKVPAIFNYIFLATSTKEMEYDVKDDNNITENRNLQVIPSGELLVNFSDAFISSYKGETAALSKQSVMHDGNDITLRTNNKDQTVPPITLIDPVQGVHYVTQDNDETIQYICADHQNFADSLVGPNVEVILPTSITVPQTAFLADTVKFTAQRQIKLEFVYTNKSVADYTFNNTNISFTKRGTDKTVNFEGKSVTLLNSFILQDTSKNPLNFKVGTLKIFDLNAIPSSSFSSPIVVNELVTIVANDLRRIIISSDSVRLFSSSVETATVRYVPLSKQETSQSSSASLLEDVEEPVRISGIDIQTNTNENIELSVEGAEIPNDFTLNLTGSNPSITLDKSWNNVQVPESFAISSQNSYTINTDLVELPNGIGDDGKAQVTHRKQKLTDNLGFIIFIAFTAVVFVIGLILCIYGLKCLPQEEVYDVSSDAIRDIDDFSAKDEKIDSNMDVSDNDVVALDDEETASSQNNSKDAQKHEKNEVADSQSDSGYNDDEPEFDENETDDDEIEKKKEEEKRLENMNQQDSNEDESEKTDSNFFDRHDTDVTDKNSVK